MKTPAAKGYRRFSSTEHNPKPSENEFERLLRQITILIKERKTLASPVCGCANHCAQPKQKVNALDSSEFSVI